MYYNLIQEDNDLEIKSQIESVMVSHPYYGHRRVALALKMNKKRTLRVMKLYGIKPLRRKARWKASGHIRPNIPNLVKNLNPIQTEIVWVSDFTYIWYRGRFIYLATILDVRTREIVGMNISRYHNKDLVLGALVDAVSKYGRPQILHSDQGSEYCSKTYMDYAKSLGIKLSMSAVGSPWENGYQESFYSGFKLEIGDVSQYDHLGKLIEAIYKQLYYYNNERIHTSLKTTPKLFRESLYQKLGA